jgi:hypothetical protein
VPLVLDGHTMPLVLDGHTAFSSQLKSEIVNILVVATRRSPHNSIGSHGTAFSSHLKFEIFNILGEGVGRADYFEY